MKCDHCNNEATRLLTGGNCKDAAEWLILFLCDSCDETMRVTLAEISQKETEAEVLLQLPREVCSPREVDHTPLLRKILPFLRNIFMWKPRIHK